LRLLKARSAACLTPITVATFMFIFRHFCYSFVGTCE
jgi:hypothetical protein